MLSETVKVEMLVLHRLTPLKPSMEEANGEEMGSFRSAASLPNKLLQAITSTGSRLFSLLAMFDLVIVHFIVSDGNSQEREI